MLHLPDPRIYYCIQTVTGNPMTDCPPSAPGRYGLERTDQCVKCALCLPRCPTYRLTALETESPRGRIRLMEALDRGEVGFDPAVVEALEHCLGCLSCEAVCPASVPYGALIDRVRTVMPAKRGFSLEPWVIGFSEHPRRLRFFDRLLRILARTGLLTPLGRVLTGPSGRALRLLPNPYPRQPVQAGRWIPSGPSTGRVALLAGCFSSLWSPATYDSAVRVLTRWGHPVEIPESPLCCGALARHSGAETRAARQREKTRSRLDPSTPLLVTDSGCWREARELADDVYELTSFLLRAWPQGVHAALGKSQRIAVHVPCSQSAQVHQPRAAEQLMEHIDQVVLLPFELPEGCCGGAGSYLLAMPEWSSRFASSLLPALPQPLPDRIVTTNLGCRMQFEAELRRAGLVIPVQHPVEVLDEAFGRLP